MPFSFLKKRTKNISLVLHIGMPKTGSTAIQDYLSFNRLNLRQKHRILYPNCGVPVNQHTALVKSIVKPLFDWAHFNEAIEQFDPEEYIKDVMEQCRRNGYRSVILSSEFLWASPAMQAGPDHHTDTPRNISDIRHIVERCRKLFDGFDTVRIVSYLRRPDEWLDSFYNQQLKDGFDIPNEEEILKERKIFLCCHRNLAIWSEFFGPDNIIVRDFDQLKDKDIISDFLSIAGIKRNLLPEPPQTGNSLNTRLSPRSTQIMRDAVRSGLDQDTLQLFRQVLQDISINHYLHGKKSGKTLFGDDLSKQIEGLYLDDFTGLSAEFNIDFGNRRERNLTHVAETDESAVETLLARLLEQHKPDR